MEKSILIISSHYYPETGAGAKRATSFAEFLASKGWKVTVITLLPNYPYNKVYEGYEKSEFRDKYENGVRVIRLKPLMVPRENLFLRMIAEFSFAVKGFIEGLKYRTGIVFVTTPYMLTAPSAYLLSRLKRSIFIWDIRDLTWLYPKFAGKKTFGFSGIFDWAMKKIASKADLVITPANGIKMYFKNTRSELKVVPNGITKNFLEATQRISAFYAKESKPVILYAGILGYMQDLSVFIEAARKLPEYEFLLIGDGPEKTLLEKRSKGLINVKFIPYIKPRELWEFYEKARVCVALLRAGEISKIAEPSKVWEYMAVGRPVVYCGEGPLAKYLEEKGLAVVCPPGDPEALASAIKKVVDSPEQAKEMARRAREFVEKERVREKILEDFERELQVLLLERRRVRSE